MGEDQRIVARPRYRDLIAALRFVAGQELIFGVHVHVGVDDPDKAIHVANGMRVHMPILLGLSANSPFWRADSTGMASTRTPIFRAFPRVGIPPTYKDWNDYAQRIEFIVNARMIEDYTYLWFDVRPHPNFGTVEVRVMDSQTRVEHTLGRAALVQALVKELSEHFEAGKRLSRYPYEMLDEHNWLAARHGLHGELVDLPDSNRDAPRPLGQRRRPPTPSLPRLRRGEIPGIRAESRPYATIVLVITGIVGCLLWRTSAVTIGQIAVFEKPGSHWWRLITSSFVYSNTGYAFITLGAIAVFGWLLERRHGPLPVSALYAVGAVGGTAAAAALRSVPVVLGANGGALALIIAWAIPDLLALRHGEQIEGDLLGALAIAIAVALMPLVVPTSSWIADLVGVLGGVVIGLPLALSEPQ